MPESGVNFDLSNSSPLANDNALNGQLSNGAGLNTMASPISTGNGQPTIAIVGAGMAGLKAAQMLLQKGYNVNIFEGRDRIGGRICTSDALGKEVDLGPNWVHGTANNPIIPLAEQAQSTLFEFSHNSPIFDSSGKLIDQKEADELQTLLWDVVEEANGYSKASCSSIPADKSFYDYCVEKADELFGPTKAKEVGSPAPNGTSNGLGGALRRNSGNASTGRVRWKGEEQRRKDRFIALAEMWGSFIGSSVQRQSLKFFYLEEPIDGPNLFMASTYKPVIQKLALPTQEAGAIRLNTPIASITTAVKDDGQKRVHLKTSSGDETFEADGVIVTAPLGCLKRSDISFNPPLPARLQKSIDSLSYGHLEKVYIHFPTAFWKAETSPAFFTFLTPKYAQETNPHGWHMCCFSLAHLPEPYAQSTLLFYIFGPASKHIVESFASTDTEKGQRQYYEFFQPYFSRIDNYDASKPECQPLKLVATGWSNDKFAGYGSYSNFQVGLEDGERDIEVLREGVPQNRLWFAGEAAGPILGLGSVSGAFWSGEIAAKNVMETFG